MRKYLEKWGREEEGQLCRDGYAKLNPNSFERQTLSNMA
jgi:hypothetical protein